MLYTQVGVMRGAGAAKTGLSWIREGIAEEEEEEEGEEGGGVASLAETEERNVGLEREDLEGEREERHQPLMEEVDIVQKMVEVGG